MSSIPIYIFPHVGEKINNKISLKYKQINRRKGHTRKEHNADNSMERSYTKN